MHRMIKSENGWFRELLMRNSNRIGLLKLTLLIISFNDLFIIILDIFEVAKQRYIQLLRRLLLLDVSLFLLDLRMLMKIK
jgi:hypothetical protein